MDPATMAATAKAVGTAVGMIGSGAVGGMFTNAGAVQSYKFTRRLQEQAAKLNYDYSQKSLLNSSSSMRKGLVNAGYNPMLAVQNSTSGANSSFTSALSGPNVDYSGIVSSSISNAQSFQRLKNETMQAEGATDEFYANADKLKTEKAMLIEKLPWVSKQEKADYMKKTMESAKLENDIHYQNEYLKYLENQLVIQEKLGLMGIDVQKRGQNISNATELLKSIGLGALGLYGIGKFKYIKSVGDIIKVIPRSIPY